MTTTGQDAAVGAGPIGTLPPLRIYEPNIIHNPYTWMGIWTPHGWRVHEKRFGKAVRKTVRLNGDGVTTFFPRALCDPDTGKVEWRDDLHLRDDPQYTDSGIYPCDPRVEYPAGQPRWQVSHTLMVSPVADHNLYTHEYTWDMIHGHLYTCFHKHVALEEARTDAKDGRTVRVRHTPISSTIEGNMRYPNNNSAVRGVWSSPDKKGVNLYTRRVVQWVSMLNSIYAITPHTPVVQCHGLYYPDAGYPMHELFDPETRLCRDLQRLKDELLIPLDLHRLGGIRMDCSFKLARSRLYETDVFGLKEFSREVTDGDVEQVRGRVGLRYQHGRGGYAHEPSKNKSHEGYRGYDVRYDMNGDGVIDEADVELIAANVGRCVRYNLYQDAYFGGDWLSTTLGSNTEHEPGDPLIADYEYGGGYDAPAGVIRLHETPGPDQPVWVEYHYDAPAEPGDGNIVLHIYREED